jgi:hypothetical protein
MNLLLTRFSLPWEYFLQLSGNFLPESIPRSLPRHYHIYCEVNNALHIIWVSTLPCNTLTYKLVTIDMCVFIYRTRRDDDGYVKNLP